MAALKLDLCVPQDHRQNKHELWGLLLIYTKAIPKARVCFACAQDCVIDGKVTSFFNIEISNENCDIIYTCIEQGSVNTYSCVYEHYILIVRTVCFDLLMEEVVIILNTARCLCFYYILIVRTVCFELLMEEVVIILNTARCLCFYYILIVRTVCFELLMEEVVIILNTARCLCFYYILIV